MPREYVNIVKKKAPITKPVNQCTPDKPDRTSDKIPRTNTLKTRFKHSMINRAFLST